MTDASSRSGGTGAQAAAPSTAAATTTANTAAAAEDGKDDGKNGGKSDTLTGKLSACTYLEHKEQRFLVMDAPNDANLALYIDALKKKNVKVVVRACEPSYATALLAKEGISVVELSFPDGDPPPDEIINKWLDLIIAEFSKVDEKRCVAVHCVAGLGRAPVLVAIALVESGMDPYDAITFIRKRRRGALNARQLKYIESYKPRRSKSCCIM